MSKSCLVCAYERTLTLHHIHPREFKFCYPYGAELIDQEINLLLVCAACHIAIHDPRPWNMMIREVKSKLEKPAKAREYQDARAAHQAQKDLMIQELTWKRSLDLYQSADIRSKLDEYRSIVQKLIKNYKGKKRG